MGNYLIYGDEVNCADSSMEAFARSIVEYLDLHYDSTVDYSFFEEESMETVREIIYHGINSADIDYSHLMNQWRSEILNLLCDANNRGRNIVKLPIHFLGDEAKKSFEEFLILYISMHLLELSRTDEKESEETEQAEGKWILTDEDTRQYRRKITDGVYELYQIGERIPAYASHNDKRFGVIHTVVHTSEIDTKNILITYDYESLDELKNSYGADWEGVLAECESEIRAGSGYGYINQDDITWKDAAALIIDLIESNSMVKGIHNAKTTYSDCTLDQKIKNLATVLTGYKSQPPMTKVTGLS